MKIIAENKIKSTRVFQERIEYLIRQQFPLRNALILRSGRKNILSYELYDVNKFEGLIDENGCYYNNYTPENPELNIPISSFNSVNISYSKMEINLEKKDLKHLVKEALNTLTPKKQEIIKLYFGFEDGEEQDFDRIGRKLGMTRVRVRLIETRSMRTLHGHKYLMWLKNLLPTEEYCCTPVGRGTRLSKKYSHVLKENPQAMFKWDKDENSITFEQRLTKFKRNRYKKSIIRTYVEGNGSLEKELGRKIDELYKMVEIGELTETDCILQIERLLAPYRQQVTEVSEQS